MFIEIPTAPGKPLLVSLPNSPDDVITLKWDRPLSDGGSPIIGYLIEHRRTGSPHWVRATPSLIQYPELTLSGLEPGWRYQFRVTAQNVVGMSEPSEVSDALTVTLQRNAITPPRFLNELQDRVVLENDQCEFTVNVVGAPSPQISWFKDGFEIFSSRRTKITTENDTSTLTIHQAALTDEGEIKCTATNRAGHIITRMRLRIEAPPKIRLPRQYEDGFLVEAGETIRLKVGIAGRPAPVITWSHNGEVVRNGGRNELSSNDKNSFLRIINAARSDRGEYNIRAINKLGEFNSSFLVTVTAKPSPPGKVNIAMSLGKSVTLAWTAPQDDGGCKIGNYVVEYYRMGWNVWLKASATRQLSTTLNDLIEGSEYKFRVKAESPYGLSEPSEESNILFVPDPRRGIVKPSHKTQNEIPEVNARSTVLKHKLPENNVNDHQKLQLNQIKIPGVPKNVELLSTVYDNEAMSRELNYGTKVDITYKKQAKTANHIQTTDTMESDSQHRPVLSRNYSTDEDLKSSLSRPVAIQQRVVATNDINDAIANKNQYLTPYSNDKGNQRFNLAALGESGDEVHTSSEFVLVLYDDENKKNVGDKKDEGLSIYLFPSKKRTKNNTFFFISGNHEFTLDLKDALSPPPLSISAPNIATASNIATAPFPSLRRSASSTELLYEKVMERFYQAVEIEHKAAAERKLTKDTKIKKRNVDISNSSSSSNNPNRQVDSINNNLSAYDHADDQTNLVNKIDFNENPDGIESDQISSSEMDDEYDRNLRQEILESERKQSYTVHETFPSALYEDDYTDSTASTASISTAASTESIEQFMNTMRSSSVLVNTSRKSSMNDELETYHPRMELPQAVSPTPYRTPEPGQAAVILTKPLPLPDPDYIPKPILKRPSIDNSAKENETVQDEQKPKTNKTEKKKFLQLFEKKKTPSNEDLKKPPSQQDKKSSNSNNNNNNKKALNETKATAENVKSKAKEEKEKMLQRRQSSIEENKVAIDHYSDLVRELGSSKKPKVPLYLNSEALNQYSGQSEEEKDEVKRSPFPSKENLNNKTPNELQKANHIVKSEPIQKDYVEISVEQTKSISYLVREIKRDSTPNSERVSSPTTMAVNTNESYLSSDGGSSTGVNSRQRQMSRMRSTSRSRQQSESPVPTMLTTSRRSESRTRNRSQSKSPTSQQRTSLTSTVLKVQRFPIRDVTTMRRSPSVSPIPRTKTPEQLLVEAEVNVKSSLNYITDFAMFLLACWLYMFKDARLAIPILVLMVYRQVKNALEKKIPKWKKD